jgi:hypothetical protein
MSVYVVLRLPLPGAVVTWFVTGSRASFFETRILGPDESKARHNHSAMIDDPGIVMGIRDQGLSRVRLRLPRGLSPTGSKIAAQLARRLSASMPLWPLELAHKARTGAREGTGLRPGRDAVSGRRRVRDRDRHWPPPGRVHPDVGSGVCHLDWGTIGRPLTYSPRPLPSTATPATAIAILACWAGLGRAWAGVR